MIEILFAFLHVTVTFRMKFRQIVKLKKTIMETCGFIGPFQSLLFLSVIGVAVLFLGLTLLALIDVLRNEFTDNNKLIWILVILFLGPIGAILYFIIGKQQKIRPL